MSNINKHDFPQGDILVVDDSKSDLKLLSGILKDAGYKVRPASDGELALRSVQARLPALILLDIEMPGLDGYEVCRRLKDAKDTRDIPVIFISVRANSLGKVKAFDVGGVDYISKPFEPEETLARVATQLALWRTQKEIKEKNLQLQQEIVERKKVEKTLADSEEKYRTVFENTGTATIIIEEDKTISMVNTQSEKMYGYSKEEIENKMKWTDFVVPEDLERMKKYHIARRKTGEKAPTEYEFRLIDKKGNIKDIFLKIGMIPGSKKSIASLMDITELKKTQERLRESKEDYFNLFNNANDLIQVISPTRKFLAVNKKWLKTLEYSQEEVKGLRVADIIRKDKLKQINEQMQEVKKGKSIDFETVFISKSGKEINIEGRGNGLFKNGKFVSIMGIFRDITERKQAEERVKHLNLVLRAIRSVNQLIVKEKNRESLLKGACNNLIKTRGYHMAWIALLDESGKLETYAEAGIGKAFLPIVEMLKKGELTVCGNKALKQQEVVITKDQVSICTGCPLAQEYSGQGAMTIRLEYNGKIYGLMTVSIPAHLAADREEQSLFKEVAGDIAFSIHNIELDEERKQAEEKLQETHQRLKKTMDAAIDTMSKIIEAKDPYTSGHQHRVCQLAVPLAQELGLSPDKVEGIRIASLIHDIGKIGLPTEILSKPGKLTDIEFSLIKDHSQVGHDILKSIDFSYPIAKIVLQHHERLDGSGYPNNLKGDEITLEAKIIGVADVVEAMSSFRPYRPAKGVDAALEEISQNKGTLYDSEVVDACLKLFKEKGFKFK